MVEPMNRAPGGDRDPVDGQALEPLLDGRHRFTHRAGAEELGQRAGVVGAQVQDGRAGVGVGPVVDGQFPAAGAVGDHRDPLPAGGDELVADTDAGQRCLGNLRHGVAPSELVPRPPRSGSRRDRNRR